MSTTRIQTFLADMLMKPSMRGNRTADIEPNVSSPGQAPLQSKLMLDGILSQLPEAVGGMGVSLGVTATTAHRGSTTIAFSIAQHAIHCGQVPVALLDASPRPCSHGIMGTESFPGGIESFCRMDPKERPVNRFGLNLFSSSSDAPFPWDPPRAERAIDQLHNAYPLSLVDLPAVDELSPAVSLARRVSGVVMVVCVGQDDRTAVQERYQTLAQAGVNVLGLVVNKDDPSQ